MSRTQADLEAVSTESSAVTGRKIVLAAEVCRLWGRSVELFDAATDEDHEIIPQGIVGRG